MEMSKTCTIPASVEATWRALNDPQFLRDCITGCESIERVGDNDFKVVMAAKIGPVSARFTGRMLLDELDPPKGYVITFEGQGGSAGFAKGHARVALAPDGSDGATLMSYNVNAQVGGKLAQIGARLIDGAARKVADDFFAAFIGKIASQQPSAARTVKAAGADVGTQGVWSAYRTRWALAVLGVLVSFGVAWLLAGRIP